MMQTRSRVYSKHEELANSLSHGLGIVLGIGGAIFLFSKESVAGDSWAIVSVIIYLFGMLSSYITSTWYHATNEPAKKLLLQKIDHAAIYLHIAGTYTPFTLVSLREYGLWGWGLFAFIWLSAIVGVIVSARRSGKHSYVETACYVIMGCTIFIAFKPLIDCLSIADKMDSIYWLVAGGVSYIVGALFYSLAKVRFMHTVFHFFVLGGSLCHIIAIYIAL